ncbi:Uncharacterized protein FWK35_00020867, partial [Aphis craccivora]
MFMAWSVEKQRPSGRMLKIYLRHFYHYAHTIYNNIGTGMLIANRDHNSEQSDGCIDFTMMCVFFFFPFVFVSVYSITSRNNAPISNYGGGFR